MFYPGMFTAYDLMPQGHHPHKPITNKLWIARQRAGYPQKWIAGLLGHRSTSSVSEYEHGRALPDLRTALKLEVIYQASLAELYPQLYAEAAQAVEQARARCLPIRTRDGEVERELARRREADTSATASRNSAPAVVQPSLCPRSIPHASSQSRPGSSTSVSPSLKDRNFSGSA